MSYVLRVAALLAAILVALSAFYELRVRSQDRTIDQVSRFRLTRIEPEVVFFGDSRGVHAFRHSQMDSRYINLSYFSEDYRAHVLRFASVIAERPGIKVLLVPLDRYSLTTHRDNEEYLRTLFFADLDLLAEVYSGFRPNLLRDIGAFYFPLFTEVERARLWKVVETDLKRLAKVGRKRNFNEFGACLELSEHYRFGRWDSLDQTQRIRRAASLYDRKYKGAEVSEDLIRAGRLLIDMAHARGITVVGIRTPTTMEWAALEDADPRSPAFEAALSRLPVDAILDYRRTLADRPHLFTDPDHLNLSGARRFSKTLYRDLQSLLEREAATPFDCSRVPHRGKTSPAWPYRWLDSRDINAIMRDQWRISTSWFATDHNRKAKNHEGEKNL